MARLTDPEKRDRQQKELVRKRGGSLMRKAEQLGRLGEIFVFTVFYDPLYGYDGIVNIPEGFEEPNIKKMYEMLRDGYRPPRRTRRRCPHSSSQRPKEPQEQPQEAVLDEITVEPSDGSCVHEDDGDSSIGEAGNQETNEPQAYSNGTSEIDAPHEVDSDFETLFGQKNTCNDLKEANFQLVRKQPSTVVKRIVGIRSKDGRFIPKRIFKVRIPRVRNGG
ncbi:hypothetical protein MCOR31_011158 [Pyricularia oryzae]|nr:hypothetical protein MCOR31_011158 [Pyricularia oryzae]